jgi:hypothetical protein
MLIIWSEKYCVEFPKQIYYLIYIKDMWLFLQFMMKQWADGKWPGIADKKVLFLSISVCICVGLLFYFLINVKG